MSKIIRITTTGVYGSPGFAKQAAALPDGALAVFGLELIQFRKGSRCGSCYFNSRGCYGAPCLGGSFTEDVKFELVPPPNRPATQALTAREEFQAFHETQGD